ncbi:MAG: hypothetical protein AAGJ86_05445 [Pseudomonadota bacterium]
MLHQSKSTLLRLRAFALMVTVLSAGCTSNQWRMAGLGVGSVVSRSVLGIPVPLAVDDFVGDQRAYNAQQQRERSAELSEELQSFQAGEEALAEDTSELPIVVTSELLLNQPVLFAR